MKIWLKLEAETRVTVASAARNIPSEWRAGRVPKGLSSHAVTKIPTEFARNHSCQRLLSTCTLNLKNIKYAKAIMYRRPTKNSLLKKIRPWLYLTNKKHSDFVGV